MVSRLVHNGGMDMRETQQRKAETMTSNRYPSQKFTAAMDILRGQLRWPDAEIVRSRFNRAYNAHAASGFQPDVAAWKTVRELFPWLSA